MREGRGPGDVGADLLVMTAFAKAPKVFRGEALDALRINSQSIKVLVGGFIKSDISSLQCYFTFVPAQQ